VPQATFAECPECGAKVRKEKLRRHMNNVHREGPKPKKAPRPAAARKPEVKFPWLVVVVTAITGGAVLGGYWFVTQSQGGGPPPPPPTDRYALIETNLGTMRVHLAMDRAATTGNHFITLVQSGTYTGKSFYRVAYNGIHVIQGGTQAPTGGTVAWDRSGYPNVAYSIAMARSGDPNSAADKDTASSEFFINVRDNQALDTYTYEYIVFGHVVSGQSVVDTIGDLHSGQSSYDGAPKDTSGNVVTVTIVSITIEG